MSMMMSQILKFADFTKVQKSGYLENKALFFLQKQNKKHKDYFMAKNTFVAVVTLKLYGKILKFYSMHIPCKN